MQFSGVRNALKLPLNLVSRLARWNNVRRDRAFDKRLGIDTADWDPDQQRLSEDAEIYVPTPSSLISRLIRLSRIDPAEFGFLDLGAGKGRTLIAVADRHRFPAIIGVELDEQMCEIARLNIGAAKLDRRVRPTIIQCDAREVQFPEGNLFIYMFNPFTGSIFAEVARRIAESARDDRAVVIAYNNDLCADKLEETGLFQRVRVRGLRFWEPPTVSLFFNAAAWKIRG